MKARLPLLVAVTALAVAVFAPPTVGNAARAGASDVKHALFADRAHYARFARDAVHATKADRAGKAVKARRANFAQNAGAVNAIQASRTPTPNMLLPLDANGKLPSSIGAVGPAGPPGPAGAVGVSAEQLVTSETSTNSNAVKSQSVSCPSGKKVLGGGAAVSATSNSLAITRSSPAGDLSGWTAEAQETSVFAGNWRVTVYAVCAKVAA
jgi:hypothetical protein